MKVNFQAVQSGTRNVWRVVQVDNPARPSLRVTLTRSGGIREFSLFDGSNHALNPLWNPAWPTIEPADFYKSRAAQRLFGSDDASRLLSGIDSPTCFPVFGADKLEITGGVHGEANTVLWQLDRLENQAPGSLSLHTRAILPLTRWGINRKFSIETGAPAMHVQTSYTNLQTPNLIAGPDSPLNDWNNSRPVTYAEHIDLGAPFVQGARVFLPPDTVGHTFPKDGFFSPKPGGEDLQLLARNIRFSFPMAPAVDGHEIDLGVFPEVPESDFATMVMPKKAGATPDKDLSWFVAVNPRMRLLFGCLWPRKQYPFLGRWVENLARYSQPWADKSGTPRERVIGWEFARCPLPSSLQESVAMKRFGGHRTFATVNSGGILQTEYWMFISRLERGEKISGIDDVSLQGGAISLSGTADGREFNGRKLRF